MLVTGFEPFGEHKTNASWEAVRTLRDQRPPGFELTVALLPVVYDAVSEGLPQLLTAVRPDLTVLCGVSGKATKLRLEAAGTNAIGTSPDNLGRRPMGSTGRLDGPTERRTELPLEAMIRAASGVGDGAVRSDDAGDYLCNFAYYRALEWLDHQGEPARAVFLHVPVLGRVWTPPVLAEGIERIVRAALQEI